MSEIKSSLLSAGAVTLCALSVFLGSRMRDVGATTAEETTASPGSLQKLLASRDKNADVPEGDYFYEMSQLLRREYVDVIPDEQKLASGAVRGMIASLGDLKSLYMDKEEFRVFKANRAGRYEGIGVELSLLMEGAAQKPEEKVSVSGDAQEVLFRVPKIPRLTVTAVAPGSPAAEAGVKPGDRVYEVNDRWVVNTDLIVKFRRAQADFAAKKITLQQLNELRKEVNRRVDKNLMPLRAKDLITIGSKGDITVTFERGTQRRRLVLTKRPSQMTGFSVAGNVIRLPFADGSDQRLRETIKTRNDWVIDLRGHGAGDFGVMKACLAAVAPNGSYGELRTQRKEKPGMLTVAKGNPNPPKLKLRVDETTRGAAEIFALALSKKGLATLDGKLSAGDRAVTDIVELPDGSGYTLWTADYHPISSPVKAAAQKGTSR